jgi:cell division protein FtsX
MPKYTFKPNYETVVNLYKENAGEDAQLPETPNGLNAILIVTAENEDESTAIRNMITHSPSWELVEQQD